MRRPLGGIISSRQTWRWRRQPAVRGTEVEVRAVASGLTTPVYLTEPDDGSGLAATDSR